MSIKYLEGISSSTDSGMGYRCAKWEARIERRSRRASATLLADSAHTKDRQDKILVLARKSVKYVRLFALR